MSAPITASQPPTMAAAAMALRPEASSTRDKQAISP